MDRFDIHISVPAVQNYGKDPVQTSESSKQVAKRIKAVRHLQQERYAKYGIRANNKLDGQAMTDYATPEPDAKILLDNAANKFKLSMRGYNRILRVSRTIADLEGICTINKAHLSEALSYRQMDYKMKL